MKAHYLGHVVFYVKNLQRSLVFYRHRLGFKEFGRVFNQDVVAPDPERLALLEKTLKDHLENAE